MKKYILRGKEPVEEPDLMEWMSWWAKHEPDRIVKQEHVGDCWISTVFLGIDHDFTGKGPPVLFETMTFRNGESVDSDRCCTWEGALKMHRKACIHVSEKQSGRR